MQIARGVIEILSGCNRRNGTALTSEWELKSMEIELDCTLEEAKNWLRARIAKGATCPLCHKYAKLYKRKLNSGMAKFLLDFYKLGRHDEFHHIANLLHFKTKTSG